MADKFLTYVDIPEILTVPEGRTGFVRIYGRAGAVYAVLENGVEQLLTNVQAPPSGGGDEVITERLVYDRPEVAPITNTKESVITVISESVPLVIEEVVAAILARAEESAPLTQDAVQNTARIMSNESAPISLDSNAIRTVVSETHPVIQDTQRIDLRNSESVPAPVLDEKLTGIVNSLEEAPPVTETNQAIIIIDAEIHPLVQDQITINANLTGYANAVASNTGWVNPNNVLGNNTNTASTLAATASGVAGTTNNTTTGTIVLDFQDVNLGDLIISDVTVNVERQGATAGVAVAQPTSNVQFQYSFDNTNWTTIFALTTPSTAKGITTLNITGIVGQNQSLLSSLRIRATGSVTSGTGLGASNTVSFFRAWMTVAASKIY